MEFQNRLFALRQRSHMTQSELAEKIDVRSAAISKYEKGIHNPTIETLIKIANLFDCTTDYLLGLTDRKKPPIPSQSFSPKESEIVYKYRLLTWENQVKTDNYILKKLEQQGNESASHN